MPFTKNHFLQRTYNTAFVQLVMVLQGLKQLQLSYLSRSVLVSMVCQYYISQQECNFTALDNHVSCFLYEREPGMTISAPPTSCSLHFFLYSVLCMPHEEHTVFKYNHLMSIVLNIQFSNIMSIVLNVYPNCTPGCTAKKKGWDLNSFNATDT